MSIVVSNKQKIHYALAGDKGPWMLLHPPHLIPMSAWKEEGYVRQLDKGFSASNDRTSRARFKRCT